MLVLVNGFPKSGTHAAAKACELLGAPVHPLSHIEYGQPFPDGVTHSVFIKRDPRNSLISRLRMDYQPVTQGTFIARFRRYESDSLVQAMTRYLGWLNDPQIFVIKYEDLIDSDTEMRRLATFLDVPYLDDAFPNLPGFTSTWNEQHSDYQKIWTPKIEKVWNEEGGRELLAAWGY